MFYNRSSSNVLSLLSIVLGVILLLFSIGFLMKVLTIIFGLFLINYGLQLRNLSNVTFIFRNFIHKFHGPFDR